MILPRSDTRSNPLAKSLKDNSHPLSANDLKTIVARHLPAWFRACAAKADAIVLHEGSFGTSEGELLLFACAIKYAANVGKTVHVTYGLARVSSSATLHVPKHAVEGVYRDRPSSRGSSRRTKISRRR